MSDQSITRRQALGAAVLSAAAVAGCRDRRVERPADADAVETVPPAGTPPPVLGWETVAAGRGGPGPRSRHGLVYDRRAKAAVLFGGAVYVPRESLPADTWEFRDRRWTRIDAAVGPAGRHRGAMTHLDHASRTLLFGGQDARNNLLADTWTYADRQWTRVPTDAAPSPRCGHALAYDEQAGAAVLFGGIDPADNPLGDTWLFDGMAWKKTVGDGPPARRYAAFAYDPELKGCLLHGGSADDAGRTMYGDAWLFRDRKWQRLDKPFETDARDDHGMGYHRSAKRMVLLDGLAGDDGLLVREPTGWKPLAPKPPLPKLQCSPLAWADDLGGLLLHGGEAQAFGGQYAATLLLHLPAAT